MNELLVYNRPKSHVSEAIRTLRTNLEFTFVGNEKNVILITSSMPGEGKSFVSANLAASFSMIDCKTILIDADMRKGRQHKIFDLDKDKGLSSLLLEDVKKYSKYICKTEIKNLDVIPSGIVPPNPSELLGSEKTKELLELLKEMRAGNFDNVEEKLKDADANINLAHQSQTTILQQEARGEDMEMGFIFIHGQDHLMTTILLRDVIEDFITLYRERGTK